MKKTAQSMHEVALEWEVYVRNHEQSKLKPKTNTYERPERNIERTTKPTS